MGDEEEGEEQLGKQGEILEEEGEKREKEGRGGDVHPGKRR